MKDTKEKTIKPNPLVTSKKHFQQDGKWVTKPTQTKILECECGNKYIKTRNRQTSCLKCLTR